MTIIRKKAFGQMNFRSKDFSVKCSFLEKKLSVKWTFGQMNFRSNEHSVKRIFGQTTLCAISFGQITFFFQSRFGQMSIF
jgi:hypothetical protein